MRRSGFPQHFWSHLLAWPGLLTVLSVLAVLLGSPPPSPDAGARMSAGSVAPVLPELRPAPQPSPGSPTLTPAAAEPFRLPRAPYGVVAALPEWEEPLLKLDLNVLGRRQIDGG
ncbi:hypothetical protein [Deinococcus puniceus]|uniref:Uncharacterized protein n=1 Tax=Deinococcus puniceus TaxID=1182568 RepID=A0A172T9C8_9DEIO|nr:hypothetical protein [Deinococcus puniceus]ANE43562.1 hypothetical protein SU48_07040 [Deinococcus puniceus]